ncbi:MAG: pitrilysin family protein [Calditrichia bacterium]
MKKKSAFAIFMIMYLLGAISGFTQSEDDQMVLYPVSDDPTISFRLWFKAGSQNDPGGKEGLAAVTASLMTEGATEQHTYEQILELLYPMAASVSSQVDKEMTIIYGRTHRDNLQDYYKILQEVVLQPAFTEKDLERVKSDLLNYIEKSLRYADDEELGKEELSEFVYQGTPYGHLEEGHVESLKSITVDDVRNFYQKYYTRENLIIGLGGGYDEAFAGSLRQDFNGLPDGNPHQPGPIEPQNINGLNIRIIEKPANATAVSFGFPINVLRGSRDYYALAIANSWLGEHRNSSSHLYQVIRETRGLNYGDYSYIEHFPGGGRRQFPPANVARRQQMFQIWIRPVPNYAKLFAFRAALRELQSLVDNGMSRDDFELTRRFLKNYVLHYAPTTMVKLGYAMDDQFYDIGENHLEKFRKVLDEITLEEVNAAIKKHLQYENMKVVFITDEAQKLKDMMVQDQPSPIEYETPKPAEVMEEDVEIAKYPLQVDASKVEIIPVETVFQ